MSISAVAGMNTAVPASTREEMVAIIAARPAALQLAASAASLTVDAGTSGEGTPAVDTTGGVDLYA